MNTQASVLTLPTQDQYQHFVTSEALSSLSHVNRYDKGLHEATYHQPVDKECPHLIFINPLLVREETSLCYKYMLYILRHSKYLIVGLWINSAFHYLLARTERTSKHGSKILHSSGPTDKTSSQLLTSQHLEPGSQW